MSNLDISPTSKKTFTSAVPFLQALPGPSASALSKLFNLRSASVTTRPADSIKVQTHSALGHVIFSRALI